MLHVCRNANITFLRAPILERIPRIVHGFATRQGKGAVSALGGRAGVSGDSWNQVGFLSAVGLGGWPLGTLRQVHSNVVHPVRDHEFANEKLEGDALYTNLSGFALSVVTADCVPVLLADSDGRLVAAAHAGWRGTSERLVQKTVTSATADFGVDVADLSAAIGPHIGTCCMEVGEEVVETFADPEVCERRTGWEKPHLNLAEANRKQLLEAGLLPERIQVSTLCTRCRADLFHSYRRDGERAGRMLSVIGIEP